ncbi:MAG: hypothetical protein AAFP02_21665, partial [Bacteroidota bacterium]
MSIEFDSSADPQFTHRCQSKRQGDWLIFSCPKCPGFERRLNWKTGETKVTEGPDPQVRHRGSFIPVG